MNTLKNLFHKKSVLILLISFCTISLLQHLYSFDALCLNEDEAAQGYNTYSVMKTGRDEYGKVPIRFLSFGENKLPLTGLISLPFIMGFGLSEFSVRAPILLIGIFFPVLFYFATLSLTKNTTTSLITAFLSSGNIWLQTMTRHQHEVVLLTALTLVFLIVLFQHKTLDLKRQIILGILAFLSLYTYHSAKIIMPGLVLLALIRQYISLQESTVKNYIEIIKTFAILILGAAIFLASEIMVPNNRIANLSYFTNPVFTYEITEGRRQGGSSLFYNKPVYGSFKLLERSLGYLSPDFLLIKSDPNPRYGANYLPLLTIVEYGLFLLGMITVIVRSNKKNEFGSARYLFALIAICSLPASLALPTYSSTRNYPLLIPILIFAGIGLSHIILLLGKLEWKRTRISVSTIVAIALLLHVLIISNHWNAYFNKYLSDPVTKGAWQCGMREVSKFAWENYDRYEKIIVSRALGQPYIFILFHGGPYPPQKYQRLAKTMPYNEYGFWEQDSFDKFHFTAENVPSSSVLRIFHSSELKSGDIQKYNLAPIDQEKQFYATK